MATAQRRERWAILALVAITLMMCAHSARAQSTIYRCDTPDGPKFSDRACGPDPEQVRIRDNRIGGSFGDNLPTFESAPAEQPFENRSGDVPEVSPEPDTCRFINSTDLRTYLARSQVVPGMTREHVERAFGRTSEVYPMPQETWVYQTKYYGALYELTYVYFRNGCVERVEYRKP